MLDEDPMKREARKRNLRISIVKGILDGKGGLLQTYSRQEIQEFFRFRRSDLRQYTEDLKTMRAEKAHGGLMVRA